MTTYTTRTSDTTAVALIESVEEHLVLTNNEITALVRELMHRQVVSHQGSVNGCPSVVEVSEAYPVPGSGRLPGSHWTTFVKVRDIGEEVTGTALDFDVKRERLKVLIDESTALETALAALKKR